MEAFDLLTDVDLGTLAAAMRSGRLQPPFTVVAVQRFCPPPHAKAVADLLQHLVEDGMALRHLTLLVETTRRARLRAAPTESVDLVWTGPETSSVANRDTGVVVRDLFGSAEVEVLVAGFAVYQGRSVFQRLAERMEQCPALRVQFFLDIQRPPADPGLEAEVVQRFVRRFRTQEWPGERLPEMYYDPRSLAVEGRKRSSLHAKCIVVDKRIALVTSANFTEAAQTRNLEVGALILSARFAGHLAEHFHALVAGGLLKRCGEG